MMFASTFLLLSLLALRPTAVLAKDPVLHHMPTTVAEIGTFLEHVHMLGKRAVDLELNHTLPTMFHQSMNPLNDSAEIEIGEIFTMIFAHTEPGEGAATGPGVSGIDRRRRLKAQHKIVDAPLDHENFQWQHIGAGKFAHVRMSPEETTRSSENDHISSIWKDGTPTRAVHHHEEKGSFTAHFGGSIDAKRQTVHHHNPRERSDADRAKPPPAWTREQSRRRRLAQTTVPCAEGSAVQCATSVTISQTETVSAKSIPTR